MFDCILLSVSIVAFLCSLYDISVSYVPKPLLGLYIANMFVMIALAIKVMVA